MLGEIVRLDEFVDQLDDLRDQNNHGNHQVDAHFRHSGSRCENARMARATKKPHKAALDLWAQLRPPTEL